MPVYDFRCTLCNRTELDVFQHTYAPFTCTARIPYVPESDCDPSEGTHPCGGSMERVLLPGSPPNVIGDECDVEAKHGICNPDGSPRRYRSKSEMAREAKKRGLVNHVEHMPSRGSDRSKHT